MICEAGLFIASTDGERGCGAWKRLFIDSMLDTQTYF